MFSRTGSTPAGLGAALICLIPLSAVAAAASALETVKLDSGAARGKALPDAPGVVVFRGVPFAAPPVGDLRWRPPRAVEPWTGVRDCFEFGPACPQPPSPMPGKPKVQDQDEDCLYLNVWTPAASPDARLPVMVWFHGGGCVTGAGSLPYYDGRRLAEEGAVVVTTNYRLGILGYLAHPALSAESERGISGNYGLMDQIATLEWVHRNIAAVGGDPDNVTVFGESAGSMSIGVLLVSPPAKGLFHRAILESGVPVGVNTPLKGGARSAESAGEEIFERLGVVTPTEARQRVARDMVDAIETKVGLLGKGVKYGPIVDGVYVPEAPLRLYREGRLHHVPIIVGSNADEGTLFTKRNTIKREAGFRFVVRRLYGDHADEVLTHFSPGEGETPTNALERLLTVSAFASPARLLARAACEGQPETYLYHFTRATPAMARSGKGATHGVEIPYVFGSSRVATALPADRALSEAMRAYWVQFARTGDPNREGLPAWPRYAAESDRHLELGDEIRAGEGLMKDECDLFEAIAWERLDKGETGGGVDESPRRRRPLRGRFRR